jgi:hypothetical protein
MFSMVLAGPHLANSWGGMKLDRLCLLLLLVAALLQIATLRRPVMATEVVLLGFLVQVTRSLAGASFVRPRVTGAVADPRAIAVPQA